MTETELPSSSASLPTRQGFDAIVKSANGGDENALSQLRTLLDSHPQLWTAVGDLTQHAILAMIRAIANGSALVSESLQRKANELRCDLLGDRPSALEKLAAERVLVCWLESQFLEAKFASDSGQNLATARYVALAKSRAQQRFDSSMKSLLLIREKQPAIERANRDLARERKRIIRLPTRAVS